MNYGELVVRLGSLVESAEAAAAVAAQLRLSTTGDQPDSSLRTALASVANIVLEDAPPELSDAQIEAAVARVKTSLKQSLDLIDRPLAQGWDHTDPEVLRAQGRASSGIPETIARASHSMPGLPEALARPGARILDVGSGVAELAMACCRIWPTASVHGIDPWEPAMRLAVQNVATAGLAQRITLESVKVEDMQWENEFDLAWFPALFIPPDTLRAAVDAVAGSLRSGGWLVVGNQGGSARPLARELAGLWAARRGGSALTHEEVAHLLTDAGLGDVHLTPEERSGALRFTVGRRV